MIGIGIIFILTVIGCAIRGIWCIGDVLMCLYRCCGCICDCIKWCCCPSPGPGPGPGPKPSTIVENPIVLSVV